jgi:hypothetical protein
MLPTDTKQFRHGALADVIEKQPDPDPETSF